ncbi:hypothetical protein [Liquorilactobacillus oeni]|uniref:Prophage Lp2 protein 7 n=1 Tax=Liquorilactobacillus oeni DSM 19972 TaxID=1423777 RepID=A0A0R1MI97_9LACO|nr:hypothetical protein [Liquorilactobacillus oeni]KRL04123.1 hypothetical protein FD46_GL001239 [Liquorilactobacillus oeni DSM 19972]
MKKSKIIIIMLLSILFLTSCGGTQKADYTTAQAEQALNKGKSIDGKTVKIKVTKLAPNSAFGYNIETGKHLNFVSTENPKVKKGQSVIVKVKKVESTLGSYIITYSKE